jgi:hypothetical protein
VRKARELVLDSSSSLMRSTLSVLSDFEVKHYACDLEWGNDYSILASAVYTLITVAS